MKRLPSLVIVAAWLILPIMLPTEACTRAVYLGPEDRILTGRSMDWKLPMVSNLWVFPRDMERDGAGGERSVTWSATYAA